MTVSGGQQPVIVCDIYLPSIIFVCLVGFDLLFVGDRFSCVDKDNLDFLILLSPPPMCWDYRYAGSCHVDAMLGCKPRLHAS